MSNILLVYASKHGSTVDIANTIAGRLTKAGHSVHVYEKPASAPSPDGFDAVILGSAVYMGAWLPAMKRYCVQHAYTLSNTPTLWLFSTGPVGGQDTLAYNTPTPLDALLSARKKPAEADEEAGGSPKITEHIVFPGKLNRKNLSLLERIVAKVVKAKQGDFRDWHAVRQWAENIADKLTQQEQPS